MRKIYLIFLLNLSFVINLISQPLNPIKILDAEKLILELYTIEYEKLMGIVDPMVLFYLDSTLTSTLIELEFKKGFLTKHYRNDSVYQYGIPNFTYTLANVYDNGKAIEKLFEYYKHIPKFIKSDTIYYIYSDLNDILRVLVKSKNPDIQERLLQDYQEWIALSKIAKPKSYLEEKERLEAILNKDKMEKERMIQHDYDEDGLYFERTIEFSFNFEEMMKFREDDLYVDCIRIAFQLAGALNYLKVNGFNNDLLENLRKQQTHFYVSFYEFKIFDFHPIDESSYILTVPDSGLIKNFNTDFQNIEKFLFKHVDSSLNARVTEIVYYKTKAYVYVEHDSGHNDYLLQLNTGDTITIKYLTFSI